MTNSKDYTNNYYSQNKEKILERKRKSYQTKKNSMKKKIKNEKMLIRKAKDAKVELMLDTRYQQQDGSYAACIRVYYQRKYKYVPTKYSFTSTEWDNMQECVLNDLTDMFNKVYAYVLQRVSEGTFSLMCLDNIDASKAAVTTLCELLAVKGEMCQEKSTQSNYNSTRGLVERVYPNGLPLQDISTETISKVKEFMVWQGYANATQNIYLTCVKAAINYATYKGWVKPQQYPFRRYAYELDKITIPPSAKRDDNYLSSEDMQALWNYFIESGNKYLGVFLFSYLNGGINLADILQLKFEDIYFEERAFKYNRKKTSNKGNTATIVPITTWTSQLLERLEIPQIRGNYVLPFLTNANKDDFQRQHIYAESINANIRRIAKQLGITKDITMTVARHTFATISTRKRMPSDMREYLMAHSNQGVSSHYVGGFELEDMRREMENLLQVV